MAAAIRGGSRSSGTMVFIGLMRVQTLESSSLRSVAAAALALACACNPEPTPGDSEGGASTTTTTGGATTTGLTSVEGTTEPTTQASDTEVSPVVSCDCAIPDGWQIDSYDVEACGWGPCGSIEFEEGVLDVVALDCALEMLIEGTPGVVHHRTIEGGGFLDQGGFVRIGEGRRGLSRIWDQEDLGCVVYALEMIELKDAAYLSECKAMPDARDRYACLTNWSAGTIGERCADEIDCGWL